MNIHEISDKFHISIAKLKRMQKAGVLIVTGSMGHPLTPLIRQKLASKHPLSVVQIFALINNPDVFGELKTKQSAAREQIAALGDYEADKVDSTMYSAIVNASENESSGLDIVMAWVKKVLPDHPVNHAWLTVRVCQSVKNEAGRQDLIYKFTQALKNIRRLEEFKGWYAVEMHGSQKRTIYFRPDREKILTTYDL